MIIAVGINTNGRREVLGMDIGPSEAETAGGRGRQVMQIRRGQGVERGDKVLGQQRLILDGRASDAGEHGGDMDVAAVKEGRAG